MPYLHRKPFIKKKPDPNIKLSDKVFFCELTEEVFTDYDEFWERLVLLNALVWTCELTGRPNLTFQEALDCENKARKCISNVSVALKEPILFISTFTKRGRLADMSDDVFNFIRDRYFVGETVEAIVTKHWYDCKVTKIVLPTEEEVKQYELDIAESDDEEGKNPKEKKPLIPFTNGTSAGADDDDDDDEIMIVRDDHQEKKIQINDKEIKLEKDDTEGYPPFPTVKYEVEEIDPWDYKECKRHIVSWDQIRRSKSAFTREKCKLFIKQCVRICPEGYWTIKDSVIQKYGVKGMSYSDIFVGKAPTFEESKTKKMPTQFLPTLADRVREKKMKLEAKLEKKEKRENDPKKKGRPSMSEEEKEAARKLLLEEREKAKEKAKERLRLKLEQIRAEKKREKELQKEEKRLLANYKAFWLIRKEDLECGDNQDIPLGTPIQCRIPNELFGDFLMVLDFVNAFAELLELGDVYPNGITFDMLEHALVEKEVAGVLNDIIQLLLGGIFSLQEEEDEEIEGDTAVDMASMDFENHLETKSQKDAVNIANKASTWSQQYQGVSLQKVPLDALTLTEVLRLHILASGATNVANACWRHMNRGGYKHTDDPGLQFKLDEPEVIKKLTTGSVFDLNINEKLKVLNVLISQILTYASVRDTIDEKIEKLKEVTNNLRMYKFAEARKLKEEITAKRLKLKDDKLKKLEKKIDLVKKAETNDKETETNDKEAETNDKEADKLDVIDEMEELEEEEDVKEKKLREEKEEKQRERRKQDILRKEKSFLEQMQNLSKGVRQVQLGQDRAYRRYWLINSLPGLFVEDVDPNPGTCPDHPTPLSMVTNADLEENKPLLAKIRVQAIRNLEIMSKEKDIEKNTSDKENDGNTVLINKGIKNCIPGKKLLQAPDDNIVSKNEEGVKAPLNLSSHNLVSDISSKVMQDQEEDEEEEIVDLVPFNLHANDTETDIELRSKVFGLCTADASTCPVHATNHNRPRWSFYHNVADLDKIIECLNARGVREGELKDNLTLHKEKIENSLQGCPAFKFDPSLEPADTSPVSLRKFQKKKNGYSTNLNFPPGTAIEKILELTLRDMILETEEKLHNGMLGSLKVHERDVWRQAILDGTSLSPHTQDLDWGGRKRINQFKSELGLEVVEEDFADTEDLVSKDGLTQAGVVKELAIAILQLAQSLDNRFLKAPLGESEKLMKRRLKFENRLKRPKKEKKEQTQAGANEESSSDDDEDPLDEKILRKTSITDNSLRTPFERWEKSLMACTSYSQLFLNLATLDNSISWSRSALANKRCRICRRLSDHENMLLCDQCDAGYHLYCLKPKLKCIPTGDWFCDKCKPKEKSKSPKKQRQMYKEESDESEEEESEEEEDEVKEFINEEFCSACEIGGELVCCDTCPRSFHKDCADLRKVPRGIWSCPLCKEESIISSNKKKQKSKAHTTPNNCKKSKSENNKKDSNRRSKKIIFDDELEEEEEAPARRGVKRSSEEMEIDEEYHKSSVDKILVELSNHTDVRPFTKPVYKQEVPDYYEKIKKPMDLRTIKRRVNSSKYTSDAEFIADVLLIFQNCQQYYKENSFEYKAGIKLSKFFLQKVKSHKLQTGGQIENSVKRPSKRKR